MRLYRPRAEVLDGSWTFPRGPAGLGHQHDGADGLAALQVAVGLLGVFQPVALADRDIDGARGDRVEQFTCTPSEFIRRAGVVGERRPGQEQ